MIPEDAPLLVTPAEAAAMLKLGRTMFGDLYRSGEIPHLRIGARVVRFAVDDLRAWIAKNRHSA